MLNNSKTSKESDVVSWTSVSKCVNIFSRTTGISEYMSYTRETVLECMYVYKMYLVYPAYANII